MLPHVSPGGVYICEDIHGYPSYFSAVVSGLMSNLNNGRPSRLETSIQSIHVYPMIIAIEKRATELALSSERHGTEWQPFLAEEAGN